MWIRYIRAGAGSPPIRIGTVVEVADAKGVHLIQSGWALRTDEDGNEAPCDRDFPRCSTAQNYRVKTKKCCKQHITNILLAIRDLFAKHKIEWWMDYGTLLGAVREGRMIPHDKDGDIGVYQDDWEKILELMPELEKLGYNVVVKERRQGRYAAGNSIKVRLSETNHTNVDIFPWYAKSNGEYSRHNFVSVDMFKGRDFPKEKLEPIGTLTYEGHELPAPADPRWFCEHRYGQKWETPILKNNDGKLR
jgi:phosphorylcholine metabolism protein LicD